MSLKDIIYNLGYLKFKDLLYVKHRKSSNDNNRKLVEELREKGVVVIPNYYDETLCDSMSKEIDNLIVQYKDTLWKDKQGADQRLWCAENLSNLFEQFHNDPFLKEMAELYHGANVSNLTTLANKITYKDSNLGSGGGWHRDNGFHKQFKSIIYLSDVNEDNGPFTYIKGSHNFNNDFNNKLLSNIGKYESRLNEEYIESVLKLGFKAQTFTAKKGTLILVDTKGIHRGSPLLKGNRYAIFNYFSPTHYVSKKDINRFKVLDPSI